MSQSPSLISFAGYWGIGFSLMVLLAGSMGLGAVGIWAALAGGTTASAAGLWIYLWWRDVAHVATGPGRETGSQRPTPA